MEKFLTDAFKKYTVAFCTLSIFCFTIVVAINEGVNGHSHTGNMPHWTRRVAMVVMTIAYVEILGVVPSKFARGFKVFVGCFTAYVFLSFIWYQFN